MIKVPKSFEDALIASIDDIALPTEERRICIDCKISKPINEFSLKVGKNNSLRKTHCVKCESARRNAKKAKERSPLLSLPCFICGDESQVVHGPNLPLGVLCGRCSKFLPNSVGNQELVEKAANYIQMTREFPFWHRALIELKLQIEIKNQTPLFDACK